MNTLLLTRRIARLKAALLQQFGPVVILSDGTWAVNSRTGQRIDSQALETLRRRGHRIVWRMISPGYLDL